MSILNIDSTITLSNQLQLTNGQLDARLSANQGLLGSASGLIVDPSYQAAIISAHITSAQFKSLVGTRQIIIPAPDTGKMITIDRMEIRIAYGTTQYTDGGNLALQYGDTAYNGNNLCALPIANTVINAATSSGMIRDAGTITNLLAPPTATGVYLVVNTTDFSSGDSDFYITVWYKIYTP